MGPPGVSRRFRLEITSLRTERNPRNMGWKHSCIPHTMPILIKPDTVDSDDTKHMTLGKLLMGVG
jgi:hypothetical protein